MKSVTSSLALLSLVVLLSTWLTAARATSVIPQAAELVAVRLRNDGSPEPDGADCTDAPCTWTLHIDCEGRIESMYGTMLQGVAVDVELIPEGPP